jgi:hypothetical protein
VARAKCSENDEMILEEYEYIDRGYGFGLLANKNKNETRKEND